MASPFGNNAPAAPEMDPRRAAALQGIQRINGGAGGAPQPEVAGPPMQGGQASQLFAQLAQAIMQEGITPETISAFQDFIQFFQQVIGQVQGGLEQQPPAGQAAPPPPGGVAGPPA